MEAIPPACPSCLRAGAAKVPSLNTATQADLEALPGIGPAIARWIVAGRPYASVEDLDRVQGIGPAMMAKLRARVTAG
jgi:competence protein ComEA